MKTNALQPGDPVVCCVTKRSMKPGPRAKHVRPDPHGDGYTYQVDKLWLVEQEADGELIVRTRRGKRHVIDAANPMLRRPSLLERLRYRSRFPRLSS